MGHGLPLRAGCFDGAISISALQWLCNADRAGHEPRARLRAFFTSLYRGLTRGSRAALQIYPENAAQAEMMVAAAMKVVRHVCRQGSSGVIVLEAILVHCPKHPANDSHYTLYHTQTPLQ
jgi:hypothetical protein